MYNMYLKIKHLFMPPIIKILEKNLIEHLLRGGGSEGDECKTFALLLWTSFFLCFFFLNTQSYGYTV